MWLMKTQRIFQTINFLKGPGGVALFLMMGGCFYGLSPLNQAKKALRIRDCPAARKFFQQVESVSPDLKWVRQAARICEPLFLKEALWFYEFLWKHSVLEEEKTGFLKKMAYLHFEKNENYEKAAQAFYQLSLKQSAPSQKAESLLYLARSWFELKKWDQALVEIQKLQKQDLFYRKNRAEILFLKARIFLMKSRYQKSRQVFYDIKEKHPVFFRDKEGELYLSLIYEIQRELAFAGSVLQGFRTSSRFLSHRLHRLRKRHNQQPGGKRLLKPESSQ